MTAIANAILRSRAGLGNENKPVGSFLLLGPTGARGRCPTRALRAAGVWGGGDVSKRSCLLVTGGRRAWIRSR